MLSDLLAISWLITGIALIITHLSKDSLLEDVFASNTLASRLTLYVITFGLVTFAITRLFGFPGLVFGMPMLHWFSLLFLLNLWFRAYQTIAKKHTI